MIADDAYPQTSPTGYRFEALSHQACLKRLHEMMDYEALRAEQAEFRKRGIYRGIGIAAFVEITNPSPAFYGVGGARISSQDGAILSLTPSGEVRCLISVTEQGQGTEAIISQIVADQLGLAQEHVKVITGDTEVTPHGGATWACRGAGIGGETALQATRVLKRNILEIAALILQEQPVGTRHHRWRGRRRRHPEPADADLRDRADRLFPLRHLAARHAGAAHRQPSLRATGLSLRLHQRHPGLFAGGRCRDRLHQDAEAFIVEDCGRVINPMLVDEQLRGGIVQGLGAALFEECRYSETGQLMNGSLADYLVPMPMEMPDIVIGHVETPTADTELGAKGVGEAGTAAASACVLNAVNDALTPFGATINSIPITPIKVLKALKRF